jgi:transcriptional regulator GlxA family with amidase domain
MPYVAQPEQSNQISRHLIEQVQPVFSPDLNVRSATRRPDRQIGIVISEGSSLLHAGVIAEVFDTANQLAAALRAVDWSYTIKMLSFVGGIVSCSSSVHIWTECFDACQYQNFDALFVAGGNGKQDAALAEALLGRMRFGYPDGSLRGNPAARSSFASSSLTESFDQPRHSGRREADGNEDRFSAMACALMLVKYDLGHDIAREAGEQLLPGAGAKLALLLAEHDVTNVQGKVRASARWLKDNCERSISVTDAAQVAAMSERNYLRRFKDEIGITPSEYLLRVRLDMVCRLLIETDLPVDKIARRFGIANGDRLAKIFRKRLLVSPTEYRSQNRPAPVAF